MKRNMLLPALILSVMLLTGCSGQSNSDHGVSNTESGNPAVEESTSESGTQTPGESNILIAYFTRIDNTDADVDDIIQGGGPYGDLGDSLEDADMDAVSSASITLYDNQVHGNTQTIAQMIQENVGGNLFSIQTEESYPAYYDELIDIGGEEKAGDARPELSSHVENMEDYDVIYLGYPNWWQDMPMPVYSFLEEYDFSGKTIIPFAVTAGSGFSNTIASISEEALDAEVVENGLHIPMEEAAGAQSQVREWLSENGLTAEE